MRFSGKNTGVGGDPLEWGRSPGDLPDPGIKPWSPSLQEDSLLSEPAGKFGQRALTTSHKVSKFWDVVYSMVTIVNNNGLLFGSC